MRSWLTLLGLALAVGGLAYFLLQNPRDGEKTYAVSTLSPSAVSRVKLGRTISAPHAAPGPGELVIEKRGDEWRLVQPLKARADTFALERLLGVLGARASVRYAATDLVRYGLDKPAAVLSANDETIVFGSINTTTREQYVKSGSHVYVLGLTHAAAIPRTADALLSKALFARDERSPVRFDLPGFTVALEEGTWAVAPITNDAGPDERIAWVDAWRNAAALTVSRHAGPAPSETVKVTLKDGRTIELGIAQRAPDVVLVREDEGVAFHFFADAGRRLLAPPATAGKAASK